MLNLYSLVEGRVKLEFPLTDPRSVRVEDVNAGSSGSALFDSAVTKQLKDIESKCKNDLLEICNSLASEKKITVSSLINMQAIMAMAEKLPMSEQEMLNIPHVTKANYEKVGKQLLPITQHYAAKKMAIMIDLDDREEASVANTSGTDWGQLARSSSTGSSGSGTKRKRGWITVVPSQRRAGGAAKRRATPKKRATGRHKRRGGGASSTPARATTSGKRMQPSRGNLMPIPGPSTNRW